MDMDGFYLDTDFIRFQLIQFIINRPVVMIRAFDDTDIRKKPFYRFVRDCAKGDSVTTMKSAGRHGDFLQPFDDVTVKPLISCRIFWLAPSMAYAEREHITKLVIRQ